MKVLAVITARGGSKGIPKKNIALLGGKPLLVYSIESVLAAKIDGKVVVSTDDEEIAKVARENGVEVIKRPPEISGDTASSESALLHALGEVNKIGFYPDAVMTIQPTSPFRKAETVKKFIASFSGIYDRYDAMLTLSEDHTVFWNTENGEGFTRLFPNAPRKRQAREPLYAENSCLYITNVDALKETGSVLGKKTAGFIVDAEEAIDINEPRDLLFAEFLMRNKNAK